MELPLVVANMPFQEIEPLTDSEPACNGMTEARLAEPVRIKTPHHRGNSLTSPTPSRSQCIERVRTRRSKRLGRDPDARAEPE